MQLVWAEFVVKSYQEIRNQNLIRQNYEQSCGAAALASVINLLDNAKLKEIDVLNKFETNSTNMVSFYDLKNASNNLNYEAKAYQISRDLLEKIQIPIIVKIEDDPRFPHFVVVINQVGNFIAILDPSFGEYISSKEQFYRLWDKSNLGGYALIIAPKSQISDKFKLNLPNKILFEIK